jgi:hypothetical protein
MHSHLTLSLKKGNRCKQRHQITLNECAVEPYLPATCVLSNFTCNPVLPAAVPSLLPRATPSLQAHFSHATGDFSTCIASNSIRS